MAGTKAGAAKTRETILARDPNHFKKIGRKGGMARVSKGFAVMPLEKRREAAAKGGAKSRRIGGKNAKN